MSPVYILKHGLSSNDAASNVGEENLGIEDYQFMTMTILYQINY